MTGWSRRACLSGLGAGLALPATAAASAREPLRFGHVGFYGHNTILTNPWRAHTDFLMAQGRPLEKVTAELGVQVADAVAAGQRVILDVIFHARKKEGIHLKPANEPTYKEKLAAVLDVVPVEDLHAMTLGEENMPQHGGDAVLRNLFGWVKEHHPSLPVYQWYMPTLRRLNVPGEQWPALPADGWVVDHYEMTGERYEALIEGFAAIGVPLVNVLWLSPNWAIGKKRGADAGWWMEKGWRVLHEQLAVSQRHDMPTCFFTFDRRVTGERGPAFYGELDDLEALAFLDAVTTRLFPFLKSGETIPLKVPDERPAWIPPWPVTD